MSKKAVRIVQEKVKERRVKGRLLYGYLGDGAGTINVPGRDGYQYARIPVGASGRYAVGVFRGGSDGEENAPIRIEVDPLTVTPANPNGEMAIMGADGAGAANAGVPSGSGSYLKLHEETHRLGGIDQAELNSLQIYQMRTEPSDTPRHVTIRKGLYSVRGTLYYLAADLDVDLTAYYPVAGTKYVYIGVDETGAAVVTDPPAIDFTTLLAAWPTDGDFLSSFVGLSVGSSIVPWQSIWDMRLVNDSATLPAATARGDIIRATAGLTWEAYSLAGAAGSFLRRDATDPLWSTLILPNAATQGDLMVATAANTIGSLVDVAINQPLLSGGIGAVPAYAGWYLVGTAGQTYTFPAVGGTLVTGTGTANYVTYWASANVITGAATFTYNPAASPNLFAQAANAAHVVTVFKAAAAQTANITEWQKSDATVFGYIGPGTTSPIAHFIYSSATTNAVAEVLRLSARVDGAGVGAVGLGPALDLYAESSVDGTYRQQGRLYTQWVDATDATRTAGIGLSFWDVATEKLAIYAAMSGANPQIQLLGNVVMGSGAAGVDYSFTVDGETNNGAWIWMEDEDYFAFSDDILMNTTEKVYWRDTDLYIYSANDGYLDYGADTAHRFNSPIYEPGTFAEIYVDNGSTAQTIPTGAAYTKLTGFATNGQSNNCTADAANDKITITKTGRYFVICSIGASSDTVATFKFAAFLNGVEQGNVHTHRKYANANDVGACTLSGIVDVTTASWDLDVRAAHDDGGNVDFTPTYMNLTITYLGET